MKKIIIGLAIILAGGILFVSIIRANLETVMLEEKEDRIRVMPVDITTKNDNGEMIKAVYYLPKIKIYPSNILYPIKIWRDNLWLALVRDPCEKSKLLMLIADKQIAEEDQISADEAVDKLIEAWDLCPNNRTQISSAAKAYRQITGKVRKYFSANEKIEKFIEEKKEIIN